MKFINLDKRFENGMEDFLKFHSMDELAYTIQIEYVNDDILKIDKCGNSVKITLGNDHMIFRALTVIKENISVENLSHFEKCYFTTGGPMFDGAQAAALMNFDSIKKMMLICAGMGFNMMMLYCEDTYEIDNEPYFGNMRSRYSKDELRAFDDYAYSLGIELIPCIQTLGHLGGAIKKYPYKAISDQPTVLMVGEERVYSLIEKMIKTSSECFRSRRIHLGLDEPWGLGLGNYLLKNGYRAEREIMADHLKRVCEIANKYRFLPMMWCDEFFRAKSTSTASRYMDPNIKFDEKDREFVPKNMELVYWDYYHLDTEFYENRLSLLKYLTDNKIVFAGCARNVRTFATHYKKGEATTNAAMTACKRNGIKDFMITVWGDDHRESSTFAILPQLQIFAEHMYNEMPDQDRLRDRFKACTNLDWEAMMDIDHLDAIPGYTNDNIGNIPVTKGIMWQNILLGLIDANLGDTDFYSHYNFLAEKFEESKNKYPEYSYMFKFYRDLANTLKIKAGIGIEIYRAYKNGDKEKLNHLTSETLPQLLEYVKKLRISHRNYFYAEYKPIGWEIFDIRYGGVIMGIDTAVKRLEDYLTGKLDVLDELEEERLSISENGFIPTGLNYVDICSANSLDRY